MTGPRYSRPDVQIGTFAGNPVVTIEGGRNRVYIEPEDTHRLVSDIADAIAWIETRKDYR